MSEARAVLKHSRIYAAAAVLNRAAAFLIIPIQTRYLLESEYGVIGVITVVSEVVGAMFGLKLGASMSRLYFDHEDQADRNEVVTSAIIGASVMVCVVMAPMAFFSEPLAKLILDVDGLGGILLLGVAGLLCNTLFNLGLQYFLIRQQSGLFLIAGTVRSILYIAASYLFIATLHMGLRGAVIGIFAANALSALGVLVPLLWKLRLRYSWDKIRDTIRFGAPLIPGQVAEIGSSFLERYLIVHMATLAAAGIYFLAIRLASLINAMVVGPFNRIYVVRRFEAHGAGAKDDESSRVFTFFFMLVTWAALGLAALAREIVAVAAHGKYAGTVSIIPLACLTQVLVSVLIIAELGIYYAKIPRYLTIANLATLAVQVGLNLFLIRRFGTMGAVSALTLATAFRLVLTVRFARGLGGPTIDWRALSAVLGSAAAVFAVCHALDRANSSLSTILKITLVFLYPLGLVLSPLFRGEERRALWCVVTSRFRRVRAWAGGGSIGP
jgi:O-antigen/teichoic acid export membrane protein